MPLSFRRSYQKIPGTKLKKNRRRVGKAPRAKRVRAAKGLRPTKYPLAIPIGCGVAVGLIVFFSVSSGVLRLPRGASAPPVDHSSLATCALETALASQLGTLEAKRTTAVPTLPPTATSRPTRTPAAIASADPRAVSVPEAACIPPGPPQTGRVVGVVDGDTIRVLLDDDGDVYSVRYIGIDALEIGGARSGLALEAMVLNSDYVYHKLAVLMRDVTDADGNGTLLRYVLVDGVFVNYALVANGHARAAPAAPDTACLTSLGSAEQQARAAGLGLWADAADRTPSPTVP
jgi:endonuclease YncB( thermonuclease family)